MAYKNYINYGIDAPPVIRNLIITGVGCLLVPLIAWYAVAEWPWWLAMLIVSFSLSGICYVIPAIFMLSSSLIGKRIQANRLLNTINWRGDETVLDAGCGRGLVLIKAAQRLPHGKAVGVDIWRHEDLSGNTMERVVINAQKAQVTDRIELHDADIRNLPFPQNTFDLIVSSLVIHNIDDRPERKKALAELIRVLKPGGTIIIQDFQYTQEYADYFNEAGLRNVQRSSLRWLIFPPVRLVIGKK